MGVVGLQSGIDKTYGRLLEASENMSPVDTFTAPRPSIEERLATGKVRRRNQVASDDVLK